jgi:5-methylcytosine-specific restriction endonuclease McrA
MFRTAAALTFLIASILPAATRCLTCQRDSRGHIKRSTIAKSQFRNQHPCPATGRTRGACPGYVIDHVVPLKRGGPDSPKNMQWQTKAEAKAKDRVE